MRPRDHTMTLGDMRANGVRMVAVSCNAPYCHHSADVAVDGMPDEMAVLFLARKFRCSRCGSKLVSARPAWHTTCDRGWDVRGLTALNVRPAPRRRCLAREAGRICAPPPRPRRSLVLGAGKFPQRQEGRDERRGPYQI
jgi:hypothetical protein